MLLVYMLCIGQLSFVQSRTDFPYNFSLFDDPDIVHHVEDLPPITCVHISISLQYVSFSFDSIQVQFPATRKHQYKFANRTIKHRNRSIELKQK